MVAFTAQKMGPTLLKANCILDDFWTILGGRTDGRTVGRTVGRSVGRSDGRSDDRMDGRSDGRMAVGRSDGRTDGRSDGRTVGRTVCGEVILNHSQMDPKWCQNVTQDGSFHGTKDGACGSPSYGVYSVRRSVRRSDGRSDGRTVGRRCGHCF